MTDLADKDVVWALVDQRQELLFSPKINYISMAASFSMIPPYLRRELLEKEIRSSAFFQLVTTVTSSR